MINAELMHNPYTLITEAKFNGQKPKINSAIEKFTGRPLVDWSKELPRVFHDEMNGYDFELRFSGTESDFIKVENAFRIEGISEDEVRIVHSKVLESVATKRSEIDELLEWVEGHPNHRFDFANFKESNAESLDGTLPYIIVQQDWVKIEIPFVSVEVVENVDQLAGTKLRSTPLLFSIGANSAEKFRNDLNLVLLNREIKIRQLFFLIHPSLDKARITRIISDLGVTHPQVVESYKDKRILQYLDDYPAVEYVRGAIASFEKAAEVIEATLARMDRVSEAKSAGGRQQIADLNARILQLRTAIDLIEDIGKHTAIFGYTQSLDLLENQILTWRNWKTKVSGEEQILRAANEYSGEIQIAIRDFETAITSNLKEVRRGVNDQFANVYKTIEMDMPIISHESQSPAARHIQLPDIASMFEDLTEESTSELKGDLLGFLGVFGDSSSEKVPVLVGNFDEWRSLAKKTVMPLANDYVDACQRELTRYASAMAERHVSGLHQQIDSLIKNKEEMTSRLSDDERSLQNDKDWLYEFEEKLLVIEEG